MPQVQCTSGALSELHLHASFATAPAAGVPRLQQKQIKNNDFTRNSAVALTTYLQMCAQRIVQHKMSIIKIDIFYLLS